MPTARSLTSPRAPFALARRALLAAALAVVCALAAGAPDAALAAAPAPPPAASAPDAEPVAEPAPPTPQLAWTAQIEQAVVARAAPDPRARAVRHLLPWARWWGGAEVLLVLGARVVDGERWLDVLVKGMPAGSHGWIPAHAATLRRTGRRIVVDLSARTLAFQRAGRTTLRTRVVVGARATPTPTGQFAVDAAVAMPRSARLGPRVLAVVAYSPTLTVYEGGLPQTAIHAAEQLGDPLGSAASNGCVRIPQRTLDALLRRAPRGTPVVIQP